MTFQSMLHIHESPRDRSDLLLHILEFFDDSPKELSNVREVAREFKLCADFIISQQVRRLVGPHIKPIQGQSNGEVFDAALQLDRVSRRWLREWDANTSRRDGFEVGIVSNYTRKRCQYDKIGKSVIVIALIPCCWDLTQSQKNHLSSNNNKMSCYVPVGIQFNTIPKRFSNTSTKINSASLPEKFLHMNMDDNGELNLRGNTAKYLGEKTLVCTLNRIKKEIQTFTVSSPDMHCALAAILHSTEYGGSQEQYAQYATQCIALFENVVLGERLPNLDIFEVAVQNAIRLNKAEKEYELKLITRFRESNRKLENLEEKVNKKFTSEEIKRKFHLIFIVVVGGLALLEKIGLV
mmetsp:Transcript_3644/g.5289  ORF Transcript_3644/g.5289 Transcript_3644/m.5289 type:complete len:351 (+) Transcript_3644:82-1134(+)